MPSRVIIATVTDANDYGNSSSHDKAANCQITSAGAAITSSNVRITSATLKLDKCKCYANLGYIAVALSSTGTDILGQTGYFQNQGISMNTIITATFPLDNGTPSAALLTSSFTVGSYFYLQAKRASGTGGVFNCRDNCQVTLTINYEYTMTATTAPTSVSLSATSASPGGGVTLSWSGAGAGTNNAISGYHIYRRKTHASTSYTYLTAVTTTATSGSCTVYAPTARGVSYSYAVYTLGAGGINSSASSTKPTLTATTGFTDPTLTVESTKIKAVHMTELQSQINALLSYYGKSTSTFTTITAGTTSLAGWTSHVNELRTAYDKLGFTHDTWIAISVNRPTAAVINQLRKITITPVDVSSGSGGNSGNTTTTTSGTVTPASTTLKPQSTVTWTTSDTSSENASYAFKSATTGTKETTLDLTSIPSNATITAATLSWSYSKSSVSVVALGSASHGVYVNGTKIANITDKSGDCKSLLRPGQSNTISAKFYQAGASFTTATSGTTITRTLTYTVSGLSLAITYQV